MSVKNYPDYETIEMQQRLKEVAAHAEKMRVVADSSSRKCIDGGYKENEAVGATAIPGADLGISMALLKMGYSPQESFDLVYDFVTKKGQSYCWHTDTHEGHDDYVVGCGHCNAAMGNAERYGLESNNVKSLLEIVRKKQEGGEGMEMTTLDREHAEQGILVVTSPDYTVKPWDQEKNVQYFIYDQTRHIALLREFVRHIESQGKNVDYGGLLSASTDQTNSTLGLLGSSKGQPMYSVDVSGDKPILNFLKNAPIIE